MRAKVLLCGLGLLVLSACAPMFAEHTSVEIYNPKTGDLIGKAYSNKGYDGFKCDVKFKANGTGELHWEAKKVNSDTVAQSVADSNKLLSQSLLGVLGAAAKVASPIK